MKSNRRKRRTPLPTSGPLIVPFEKGDDPQDAGKLIFTGPLSTSQWGLRIVRYEFSVEVAGSVRNTEAAMRKAWKTKATEHKTIFGELGFVKRVYSNSKEASFAVGTLYDQSYPVSYGVWGEIKLRRVSAERTAITGQLKYRAPRGVVATVRMFVPSLALAKWGNSLLANMRTELSARTI